MGGTSKQAREQVNCSHVFSCRYNKHANNLRVSRSYSKESMEHTQIWCQVKIKLYCINGTNMASIQTNTF